MESGLKIDITALQRVFANLPNATRRKAIRPALRAGAEVVKEAAAKNINAITEEGSTGIGAKSLAVYSLRIYKGRLRAAVSVRRGAVNKYKIVKGKPVRVGLYLSVLEYGKNNQAPRSWLRKAAREKAGEALQAIRAEAAQRMNTAIREAKT